ncbi:MAG TPA: DUF488 family protein [Candidatus Paceibacterota bacterium]|jgi:Uncharacterized conserved protein
MTISFKRIYDKPSASDGMRVLVDRLWPRGVSKASAHIDLWIKEITPSNELRKWFHVDPDKRFAEFSKRYRAELRKNHEAVEKARASLADTVTFVSAVKDVERSHVPILRSYIERR